MKNKHFLIPLLALLCAVSCKTSDCVERATQDCICTKQYDPVCGCNKKTYGNACMAKCAGIKKYTKGECPK